jgi:hypothetical protein
MSIEYIDAPGGKGQRAVLVLEPGMWTPWQEDMYGPLYATLTRGPGGVIVGPAPRNIILPFGADGSGPSSDGRMTPMFLILGAMIGVGGALLWLTRKEAGKWMDV